MDLRKEFTGMLPGSISKFEELLKEIEGLNPQIVKGYDSHAPKDDFFYWGCACRIACSDMQKLKEKAESLGIVWLSDDGDMAYTNGLQIDDFMTYRVNGDLELVPVEQIKIEEEVLNG
ncbi:MAG TPA: hypothetical protein P5239_10040 [Victivallales bacterium]|nr:hypothetical protein [Victivallales bacterium]